MFLIILSLAPHLTYYTICFFPLQGVPSHKSSENLGGAYSFQIVRTGFCCFEEKKLEDYSIYLGNVFFSFCHFWYSMVLLGVQQSLPILGAMVVKSCTGTEASVGEIGDSNWRNVSYGWVMPLIGLSLKACQVWVAASLLLYPAEKKNAWTLSLENTSAISQETGWEC